MSSHLHRWVRSPSSRPDKHSYLHCSWHWNRMFLLHKDLDDMDTNYHNRSLRHPQTTLRWTLALRKLSAVLCLLQNPHEEKGKHRCVKKHRNFKWWKTIGKTSPSQVVELPGTSCCPEGQSHWKLPGVFTHVWLHPPLLEEHSSMSVKKINPWLWPQFYLHRSNAWMVQLLCHLPYFAAINHSGWI